MGVTPSAVHLPIDRERLQSLGFGTEVAAQMSEYHAKNFM